MKALRLAAQMTQADLAARMGVTVMTISRWENGPVKPPKRARPKLARVLGVSVHELGFSTNQQ